MKVFREFVLLSFLALASGRNSFNLPQQLMEAYSRNGVLETIPWPSFLSFEKEWRSMLNPQVSPVTTKKLNNFFDKLTVGRDNHHRTMDSIVAMCNSAENTLPLLLDRMDLTRVNKALVRLMNAFRESKAHLDVFKSNLEAAAESVDFDPESETSDVKRIVITDFNNGTVMVDTEGGPIENLNNLLGELSTRRLSPSAATYINLRYPPRKPADSHAPKAFFSRLNSIKSQLKQAVRSLDYLSTDMQNKLDNFAASDELPSREDVESLLTKCEMYNPSI